jgi:hypothetical protein
MDIKDISALTFNQTTIINPDLSMNYKSDTLYVDLSVNYDTLLNIHTNLIGNIEKEYFNLQIDTLSITALNRYTGKMQIFVNFYRSFINQH